jgi:hypothetical protein
VVDEVTLELGSVRVFTLSLANDHSTIAPY